LVHGAKVYILGRSQSKFESCVTRLSSIQSNRPHFIPCDLASILSTKTAAEKVLSLEPIIHVLFCSAGLAWFPYSSKSGDGYELTWHTNVMGHFILSQLLMDALEKGFEETGKKGRVVWTSSYGLNTAPKGGVALESLKADDKGMVGAGFNRQALYGQVRHVSLPRGRSRVRLIGVFGSQSKLAMVVVSNEIERRHGDKILTIALNPGST